MQFNELNIIAPILKALEEEGYASPTPIQEQAIPIILQGTDLLGCAQTGTGKTAAFAIPILQLLSAQPANARKRKIRCLILTPTRELAVQIGESFTAYGRHTGMRNYVIFGGVNQNGQTSALTYGTDILIATPGRLLDLMNQGYISLKDVELFVLDEADRMLDMGFIHDVRKLLAALPHKRQTLFFSATMPAEIVKLSSSILTNPSKVEVTPVSSTAETVTQELYYIDRENKNALLEQLLRNPAIKTALVFTRTKHGADKVVKFLEKHNIKAEAIHGNKSQNARQRALNNFKDQSTRILVATDIAARGIDVDSLEYVINYEIPNVSETYVHRIGRTGRAGAKGTAISFSDGEEKAFIKDIEKLINKRIPVVEGHDFPMMDHNPPPQAFAQRGQGRSDRGRESSRPARPSSSSSSSSGSRSSRPSSGSGQSSSAQGFPSRGASGSGNSEERRSYGSSSSGRDSGSGRSYGSSSGGSSSGRDSGGGRSYGSSSGGSSSSRPPRGPASSGRSGSSHRSY